MKLKLRSRSKRGSRDAENVVDADSVSELVKELTATFGVFDRDSDGRISRSELGTVLTALGDDLNDSELDELMSRVDGDGDGFIDLQEFIAFHTEKGSPATSPFHARSAQSCRQENDDLQSAFDVFDADKNGFISAEELQRVMRSLGDNNTSLAECRHMINCVDKDGDHMVNFLEFQCLMAGADLC